MRFDQVSFWLLFVVAWVAWRWLPFRAAKGALLVASIVFYAWWRPEYVLLLLFSAGVDFTVARRIHASDDIRARKRWLWVSLATNLGLLAFFKYTPLVVSTSIDVAGWLGADASPWALGRWVVPVGISFYTFQTLSYSLDVYRGRFVPITRFADFLLYVTFFPQLVAGPIVRAAEFLPQLARRRPLSPAALQFGVYCVLQGLFLKVVIADNLARQVERAFDAPGHLSRSPLEAWLGTLYFGAQIFADFAGYSRIAIGLAYLLGLRFPENFRYPYIARSLSEFWTRWHITLSSWLRDYLYIPLGGNRGTRARTYVNLMVTMLLGGLWHGAAWTYLAWGALHGAALGIERALGGGRTREGAQPPGRCASFVRIAAVFLVVHVAWVFFRARSFEAALGVLRDMFVGPFVEPVFGLNQLGSARHLVLLAPLVALHVAQWAHEHHGLRKTAARRMWAAVFFTLALLLIERGGAAPFLYFQF
ncbi:MAG: MBOAT family O-acyltransferase [Planctomycetota bacterium]